jgi:hypothetical protein
VKPVRHAGSNVVYEAQEENVGDLWCERIREHEIQVVLELDDHDRAAIAQGARIMLIMFAEPIPPINMLVLEPGQCEPVAEHGWKGQSTDDLPDSLPADWRGDA